MTWEGIPSAPAGQSGPEVVGNPADLPEVQKFIHEGWFAAPDSPALSFLPAVWPVTHCVWLPDRSTHLLTEYCNGEAKVLPWPSELLDEIEAEFAELAASAGLPGRPSRRVWLLRPFGDLSIQNVLDRAIARAVERDVSPAAIPGFVAIVREVIDQALADHSGD